jgi:hypothetical protein
MKDTDQISRRGLSLLQQVVLDAGHIFREQPISDYGIDAHIEIKEGSKPTGRLIAVQVKSGSSYFSREEETGFWHSISDRHRELWLNHSLPVILVLCDVQTKICYYEIVTNETCVLAGGKWKVLVPKSKIISPLSGSDLADLASPIAAASDYTIIGEQDGSFAQVRRINYDVLVHPGKKALSRPFLGAIMRSVLKKGQSSDYHRDEISELSLSDRPMDVVSGYLYTRSEDRASGSWVCRFLWVSPDLDLAFRPSISGGEPDGCGLEVTWKPDMSIAEFVDSQRVSKAVYLKSVDRLLTLLQPVRDELALLLEQQSQVPHSGKIVTLVKAFNKEWDTAMAPPAECYRLSVEVNSLRAMVDNIKIIWERQTTVEDRGDLYLLRTYQDQIAELVQGITFLRKDVR